MGWAILKRFAYQRITPNVNNPHYIRGGRREPAVCATIVSQPPGIINGTVGVPFSYNFGQHFSGSGASRVYTWTGLTPPWATMNPTTGVFSGTPTGPVTVSGQAQATQDGCAVIRTSTSAIAIA